MPWSRRIPQLTDIGWPQLRAKSRGEGARLQGVGGQRVGDRELTHLPLVLDYALGACCCYRQTMANSRARFSAMIPRIADTLPATEFRVTPTKRLPSRKSTGFAVMRAPRHEVAQLR